MLGAVLLSGCALVAGLDEFGPAGAEAGGGGAAGQPPIGGQPPEGGGGLGAGAGGEAGGGGAAGMGGGGNGCATDLVISEVRTYGSGAGDDDFVEIFNPTAQTISLEDVSLAARTPTGPLGERWRGDRGEYLEAGGHFLIAGQGFDEAKADVVLLSTASFGNNVILLLRRGPVESTVVIDIVCVCTNGCKGEEWNGCDGVVIDNPAYVDGDLVLTDDSQARDPECRDTDTKFDFDIGAATPNASP